MKSRESTGGPPSTAKEFSAYGVKALGKVVDIAELGGERCARVEVSSTNQYGQTKPYSEVKDELTTAKTQLFSLDELTAKKTSVAATVTGNIVPETGANSYDWVAGLTASQLPAGLLSANAFTVDIDNSGSPVSVDLSKLASLPTGTKITGDMIAEEATNQLISTLGI